MGGSGSTPSGPTVVHHTYQEPAVVRHYPQPVEEITTHHVEHIPAQTTTYLVPNAQAQSGGGLDHEPDYNPEHLAATGQHLANSQTAPVDDDGVYQPGMDRTHGRHTQNPYGR